MIDPNEPDFQPLCDMTHKFFKSFVAVGFTEDQALHLTNTWFATLVEKQGLAGEA